MQMCVSVFFTFYILFLYIVDAHLRWRYTDHGQSYFVLRLFIASLFLGLDIFLIIESKRILAVVYSLQSLSLLLSFIIQVMMSSRSVLGTFTFEAFQDGPFPWILSAFVLVVLGLLFPAFAFIFRDSYIDLGRVLVVAGCVLGYGFLGFLAIGQLDRSGMLGNRYKEALALLSIFSITLVAMPTSVLFLCWHDTSAFLLAQMILSSIVTTSWIALTLYKFEERDDNSKGVSHIEG